LDALHKGIQQQIILAAHDISEGGAFTALFEMCVGGNLGATIDVIASKAKQSHPEQILFNETAGSFIVEIENKKTAEKLFKDVPHTFLGTTTKEKKIQVISNKKQVFMVALEELQKSWEEPMKEYFK
jgi:phosphoribosylformylglycinamidine synthase